MITKNTAGAIVRAYTEIEAAEKLLKDIAAIAEAAHNRDATGFSPFDTTARVEVLVPSGERSHRICYASPIIAVAVVNAHIADMRRMMAEANEAAKLEA